MLWGVLAAVLRFIPYLGPWLAALFPLTIAFGVDPGWSMLLWTIALFLVVELISNNAIEPWLYGSSTGLSSFAIVSPRSSGRCCGDRWACSWRRRSPCASW